MSVLIGIYAIENKINHMVYVGQSRDIKQRFFNHGSGNNKTLLGQAIKQYGRANFIFRVLEECSEDDLDRLEIHYIKTLNSLYPNGYNLEEGGKHCGHFEELNPNTCLTKDDVYQIREDFKNHVNVNDAYAKVADRMTINGFKSIWSGRSWRRIHMDVYTRENRRWHRVNFDRITNHSRIVCDEDVLRIRDIKNDGELSKKEAGALFPHINVNTFNDIWYNHTFKHLKSDRPVNNPGKIRRKPTDQYGHRNPAAKFTANEVIEIRRRKNAGEDKRTVYQDYKHKCCSESFSNLWKGRSYQNV